MSTVFLECQGHTIIAHFDAAHEAQSLVDVLHEKGVTSTMRLINRDYTVEWNMHALEGK